MLDDDVLAMRELQSTINQLINDRLLVVVQERDRELSEILGLRELDSLSCPIPPDSHPSESKLHG